MLRLFVAVALPEDALRACGEEARRVERALGRLSQSVRFARPEGLHFTLKFLGWTPEDQAPAIASRLDAIAAEAHPFPLALQGFEAFPSAKRPRVVFIPAVEGGEPLKAIAQRVEEEIAPLGFPTEGRPFVPHITLLRVKEPKNAARIGGKLTGLVAGPRVTLEVRELILMRSELHPSGSRYTPFGIFPFPTPESAPSPTPG